MSNAVVSHDQSETNRPSAGRPIIKRLIAVGAVLVALLILAFCSLQRDDEGGALRQALVDLRDHYKHGDESVDALSKRLQSPSAILEFVAARIVSSPYSGRLQSPEEVLRTRNANPADKAALVQAMLKTINVETTARASALPDTLHKRVFAKSGIPQKERPKAYDTLLNLIDYSPEDAATDDVTSLVDAGLTLIDRAALIDDALKATHGLVPLEGLSSSPGAYLDWVWLATADGTVYDPVLPGEPRPEYSRLYERDLTPVSFSLVAEDKFARRKTVLDWQGAAYGKSVTLGFLPTINPYERLLGAPDLADVALWTPVLKVGNELHSDASMTPNGDVAPAHLVADVIKAKGADAYDAPPIEQARITSVDSTAFPLVRVKLSVKAKTLPRWHSGHVALSVDGKPLGVQIEEQTRQSKPVIIVMDQTGSMLQGDRSRVATAFGQTLVANLSTQQRVALFGMRHAIHAKFLFDVREDLKSLADDVFWRAPVGGQYDFTKAIDVALNAIMIDFGEKPKQQTQVVLVTDGSPSRFVDEDYRNEVNQLIERAKSFNASVVAVTVGGTVHSTLEKIATETGGRVVRVASEASARSDALSLADQLAGSLIFSFEAPVKTDGYTKDESLPFTLRLAGFDGQLTGTAMVPETISKGVPALYLKVSSGEHSVTRKLMALGPNVDHRRFTADTSITLASGYFDADTIEAGRYDRWLLALDALTGREEDMRTLSDAEGVDVEDMERANRIANLVDLTTGEQTVLRFPMATLATSMMTQAPIVSPDATEQQGEPPTEAREISVTLDTPAWHGLTLNRTTRNLAVRTGLSLNDAEARSLGDALNLTALLASSNGQLTKATTATVRGVADRDLGFSRLSGQTMLRLPGRGDVAWLNHPDKGSLNGVILRDGLAAKGTQDIVTAEKFARIRTALDIYDVATSPMPGVAKIAYKGLIGFKLEELKMWCFSTIMLGYVNEVIAGEEDALLDKSVKAAEARAAKLCKMKGGPGDFAKNLANGAASAFAKAWAKEFVRKGVNGKGGTDRLAKPYVDRFTKSTGLDKARELFPPTAREYISKVTKSIRRKTPVTPEGISETVTSAGLNGLGGAMGPVFSTKLAGAIQREASAP